MRVKTNGDQYLWFGWFDFFEKYLRIVFEYDRMIVNAYRGKSMRRYMRYIE